jgi:hypothetical protein
VPEEHRRTFLGYTAAAMLAAVGAVVVVGPLLATAGQRARREATKGIRPDPPDDNERRKQEAMEAAKRASAERDAAERTCQGIRPDRPPESRPLGGVRPD